MGYRIVDAHMHLWEILRGQIKDQSITHLGGGRALFLGEERQMMPPYMVDGSNTAELFISNMDYAGVSAAVVTQEYIDGEQNGYLLKVKENYPDRFFVCGLAEFRKPGYYEDVKKLVEKGFKGIKLPAQRLHDLPSRVYLNEPEMMQVFQLMEEKNMILSIDLAEGDIQVGEMEEVLQQFPKLKVAVGHFGMVNRPRWEEQVKLALHPNVMLEAGGITWLFHKEFYPYNGAVQAIKRAASLVGMEKLMWGSDYPRTMTAITYKMSFDFILKSKEFTEEEKKFFLGENAIRFYGFTNIEEMKTIRNMVED